MAGSLVAYVRKLTSSKAINVTAKGVVAWRKWGLSTDTSGGSASTSAFNGSKLSDLTAVGGTKTKTGGGPALVTWTNGSPAASGSSDPSSAIMSSGLNNGFTFTAEAGTGMRTLKLLAMPYAGQLTVTATLGDASASPASKTIKWRAGGKPFLLTFHFKANGSTTLTVAVNQDDASGSAILAAAWLYGSVIQEDYQEFKDDGSESGHTALAAQGTPGSVAPGTNVRARFLLSNPGADDSPQMAYKYAVRTSAEADSELLPLSVAASGRKLPKLLYYARTPFNTGDPESSAAQTGPWVTITPPTTDALGNALPANCYVGVMVNSRDNQAIDVHGTNNGGQTWSKATQVGASGDYSNYLWCKWNGSWTGTLQFGHASITQELSAAIEIWGDVDETTPHDVAPVGATYTASTTPSVDGSAVTTSTANAVGIVRFTSADNNSWGSQTSGWESTDGASGLQNNSGTGNSQFGVYKEIPTSGTALGNVSATQTARGADAGTKWYMALKGEAVDYDAYMAASSYITDGEPTTAQMLKA